MPDHPHFASHDRPETIARMSRDTYDVAIIGGGITGCGTALDAASRGLKVALVEREDVASGTSSKSSKMVHGGLRYLQTGDVRLVYEALAERQRILRIAPHLVREVDFLVLVGRGRRKFRKAIAAALWAYDLTGGFRIGKLHKKIGATETVAQMPTMPAGRVECGYYYPDARADDARLTMYLARTAAVDHGADILTYASVDGLERDTSGRVSGVAMRDHLGGAEFCVRARYVVNAGGVWTDEIRKIDEGNDPGTIRKAKGIHIVVPWTAVRNMRAMALSTPDRHPFFIMPWGNRAYVGTTDTDYEGPLRDPQATPEDILYLLDALNSWLTNPLEPSDIIATWAGLRPLVHDASTQRTADLSRRHALIPGSDGFVTITGGKLTTYRRMAQDTIDFVLERSPLPRRRSPTKTLRLDGACRSESIAEDASALPGGAVATAAHLLGRHGSNAAEIYDLVRRDTTLGERIVADLPYLRAEVVHAVQAENAQTAADVLERRTRICLEDRSRGLDALEDVVTLMSGELGWDAARVAAETDAYRERVAATLRAEEVTASPTAAQQRRKDS